jgi:integrase
LSAVAFTSCGTCAGNDKPHTEPVPKVSLFREKDGRIRSLTPDEFSKLLAELPPHLADIALFSVATGLRQANVSQLEWSEVNLDLLHAVIPPEKYKNGKPHPVPLNEAAMEVIKRKVGQHPTHVFTYRGKPVTQVSTKAWRDAVKRAGIDNFRWHDLRHTFATWHRQAGTPTHELQRLGGWKTLSMVERYAHVAPEGLQVAASRLDNALRGTLWLRSKKMEIDHDSLFPYDPSGGFCEIRTRDRRIKSPLLYQLS